MSDLLQAGATWLAGVLKQHASTTVTYRRGSQAATIAATLGESLLRIQDGDGNTRTERTDRDFIVTAADLPAAGIALPPANGDLVDLPEGALTKRYAVLPYGREEPLWRPEDHSSPPVLIRIHGKYRGTV